MSVRQIARFGSVGVFATIVHIGLGSLFVFWGLLPLLANFAAFCAAFVVSYLGHRNYSFATSQAGSRNSFPRFFLVSFTVFVGSSTLLSLLIAKTNWPAELCLSLSVGLAASTTFAGFKFWVFKEA